MVDPKLFSRFAAGAVAALVVGLSPLVAWAADLTGPWSATASVGAAQIPFRLDLKVRGTSASGSFFDGSRPTNPSTAGVFKAGHLHLVFASYAATLDADVVGDHLDGAYVVGGKATPIHAVRGAAALTRGAAGPNIAGEWIIPFKSPKGETAWRLIVRRKAGETQAAILRIDGDTGTLNGRYSNGAFHLSHFAGERAARLDITVQPDHTLKLALTDSSGERDLVAVRAAQAASLGAAPTDPTQHTSVRNPAEPFRFSFPDLAGHTVSNADRRFRGKVVVIDIMGSWCPNCHDEAPFLQSLYAKYHARGLEVVALDFEQADQLANPQRLRAFVQRYGLQYTVLLAGDRHDVNARLPQAVNLDAWPTTFFVGRDGLVKSVHVGFTSPGSGPRDIETRTAVERQVVGLLAAGHTRSN